MALTNEEKNNLKNTYSGLQINEAGTYWKETLVVSGTVIAAYKGNSNALLDNFTDIDTWCQWVDNNS
jgi:hypothetical protein